MSYERSFLKSIDYFKSSVTDDSSRSNFGGLLTLIMPILVIFYSVYQVVNNLHTIQITTETGVSWDTMFALTVTCVAPQGCYFTEFYNGPASQKCKSVIDQGAVQAGLSPLSTSCQQKRYGENFTIPFCYTADPLDGPVFIWKRNQTCSNLGSLASTNQPDSSDCRFGLLLQKQLVNRVDGSLAQTDQIPLFYGIHALNINMIKHESNAVPIFEISSVHVSDETEIDGTNKCCQNEGNPLTKCSAATNANNQYVLKNSPLSVIQQDGEWYQLKLRTFPEYNQISIKRTNLWSTFVNSAGSLESTLATAFGLLVTVYLKVFGNFKTAPAKSVS